MILNDFATHINDLNRTLLQSTRVNGPTPSAILLQHLRRYLQADIILLGEMAGAENVRVVAAEGMALPAEGLHYRLAGSPCERAEDIRVCLYRQGVAERYPQDSMLAELGIQGYAGIALLDSKGNRQGIVSVLYRRPIPGPKTTKSMLGLAAAYLATDLERDRITRTLNLEREILERVAQGEPAKDVLALLCRRLEALFGSGTRCSILRAEDGRLWGIAAPSLPAPVRELVEGLEIGPDVGSCGAAVHAGNPVIVSDVFKDRRWLSFRDAARANNIRACWSIPLRSRGGRILGSFAIYHDHIYTPLAHDIERASAAADLAAIVLEHQAAHERLLLMERAIAASTVGLTIADARAPDLPLVFVNAAFVELTGYSREELLGRNCRMLSGPDTDPAALAEIRTALTEQRSCQATLLNYRRDGRTFWNELTLSPIFDAEGEMSHVIGVQVDVTARVEAEQQKLDALAQHKENETRIHFLSHYDPLTGLANRAMFQRRLHMVLETATHTMDRHVGVFLIDLDGFGNVNDTLGQEVGDQVLREVGQRLLRATGDQMTVSRLGGDGFGVLVPDLEGAQAANSFADRLVRALSPGFVVDGHDLHLSACVGAAVYPEDGDDAHQLVRNADTALHRAKKRGHRQFLRFRKSFNHQARYQLDIQMALRQALREKQLQLHYQPKIDLRSRRVCGFEALLRWQHPQWGTISPDHFISIAEQTGTIVELGEWVLNETCRQLGCWQAAGLALPISVNLSAIQIHQPEVAERFISIVGEHGVDSRLIEFELTESALMQTDPGPVAAITALHHAGMSFAVDDFGTGYSSLAYLKRLPVRTLKVDQTFVRDIVIDPSDRAIVDAVIGLAHHLGLMVVAEGVENAAQLHMLQERGCDQVQGFLLGKPKPAAQWHLPMFGQRWPLPGLNDVDETQDLR